MKVKDYLNHLNKIIKENPQIKEYELIYSIDDEGNEYNKVNNLPAIVQVENIEENRFLEIVGFYENGCEDINKKDCNALIIN